MAHTLWRFSIIWRRLPAALFDPLLMEVNPWWKRAFGDPDDEVESYIGTVNSRKFYGMFAPWTLLYLGASFTRNVTDVGGWVEYDVEFNFEFDPKKHNYAPYFDARVEARNGWYQVGSGDHAVFYEPGVDALPDEASVHPEREFNDLFFVGSLSDPGS